MPSSISSSDRRLPRLAWAPVLGGALAIAVFFAAYLELRLALRGFRPMPVDSERLWIHERERASDLGSRALILVGASRIQIDVDLGALRRRTGLEPVQLAIDGTDFVGIFGHLASDPTITGTVMVDFSEESLTHPPRQSVWEAAFERERRGHGIPDFQASERWLGDAWHGFFRSYADGARPLDSLLLRILPRQGPPQYLTTLPNRERFADYSKVSMPGHYYSRVQRNLGHDIVAKGLTLPEFDAALAREVAGLAPQTDTLDTFRRLSRRLAQDAAAIEARGGHVDFLMMPRSGLVRAIDDRRFPRPLFWDPFAAQAGVHALSFEDVPALRDLACPDGSHLDVRQRAGFTNALVDALGLGTAAR